MLRHYLEQGRIKAAVAERTGQGPQLALERHGGLDGVVEKIDQADEETRTVLHQDTPALEQVRAGMGHVHPVADHMRQGRLDHLPGMVRRLKNSVKVFTGLYLYRVERLMVPP